MSDKVTVVTSALRAESKKWESISERLRPIGDAAANATLGWTAFFAGPNWDAAEHSDSYDQFQNSMMNVLYQGVTECHQMAQVLNRVADNYDVSDEESAQDLDKIYSV